MDSCGLWVPVFSLEWLSSVLVASGFAAVLAGLVVAVAIRGRR